MEETVEETSIESEIQTFTNIENTILFEEITYVIKLIHAEIIATMMNEMIMNNTKDYKKISIGLTAIDRAGMTLTTIGENTSLKVINIMKFDGESNIRVMIDNERLILNDVDIYRQFRSVEWIIEQIPNDKVIVTEENDQFATAIRQTAMYYEITHGLTWSESNCVTIIDKNEEGLWNYTRESLNKIANKLKLLITWIQKIITQQ